MQDALLRHWPEYLMEAFGLGAFMVSACLFCALLELPESPVRRAVPSGLLRRALMGVAMGLTAVAVIYSPWGKQSGAHLNPAVTLTFFRLGKVAPWDAAFYVLAQAAGGVAGVLLSALVLGKAIGHPTVNYVVTVPGPGGAGVAFAAEVGISFLLMLVVLTVSSQPSLAQATGLFAGALVALYILLEAPYSGMSMNPARTLASALPARTWTALWLYLLAPPLGMLGAAEVHLRLAAGQANYCAKLCHDPAVRCIFCDPSHASTPSANRRPRSSPLAPSAAPTSAPARASQ